MTTRREGAGSRFLYDSFDAAQARIEANERVMEERWIALDYRLGQIDAGWSGWKSASGWGFTAWRPSCWRRGPRR
jgi:hypothetical protein